MSETLFILLPILLGVFLAGSIKAQRARLQCVENVQILGEMKHDKGPNVLLISVTNIFYLYRIYK